MVLIITGHDFLCGRELSGRDSRVSSMCRMQGGERMSYEPPLNDPDFYEDEAEELSPEFDTLEEMEGEN